VPLKCSLDYVNSQIAWAGVAPSDDQNTSQTHGSLMVSRVTGYFCTVSVNDFDPICKLVVAGYWVSRDLRLTFDIPVPTKMSGQFTAR
jgi:hypothetical protein